MKNIVIVLAAMVASLAAAAAAAAAAGAAAQEKICLRNNRIWSWDVVNERLLVVEDMDHKKFAVHLTGGCVGLDNARLTLAFQTATHLGCMTQGDKVLYRAPALGRMSCVVTQVDAVRPGTKDDEAAEK